MAALIGACYAAVAVLASLRILPWFSLAILLSLPRAVRVFRILGAPVPESPEQAFRVAAAAIPRDLREKFDPDHFDGGFPLWPLWFVAWVFVLTRLAGGLFVLGLAIDVFVPWRL